MLPSNHAKLLTRYSGSRPRALFPDRWHGKSESLARGYLLAHTPSASGGAFRSLRSNARPLTKRQLAELLSQRSVVSKKNVEYFLSLFAELICEALKNGRRVQLIPFGTFDTRMRKARQIQNPKTKKIFHIAAARVPIFRPGKLLKQSVK